MNLFAPYRSGGGPDLTQRVSAVAFSTTPDSSRTNALKIAKSYQSEEFLVEILPEGVDQSQLPRRRQLQDQVQALEPNQRAAHS